MGNDTFERYKAELLHWIATIAEQMEAINEFREEAYKDLRGASACTREWGQRFLETIKCFHTCVNSLPEPSLTEAESEAYALISEYRHQVVHKAKGKATGVVTAGPFALGLFMNTRQPKWSSE